MSQPLSSLVPTASPQQVAQSVQYVQVPQQSVQYDQQPQQYVVKETVVRESCPVKPACPPPKPVCKPACDPCAENRGYDMAQGWGWLAALVMWFILLTVFLWLILYSLRPSWVLKSGSQEVDTAKVLLAAVIGAVILLVIFWLIKLAVSRAW